MMVRKAGYAAVLVAVGSIGMFAQAPAGTPAGQPPAAQPPAGRGGGRGGPPMVSPEVKDKSFTVRFRAPEAKEVIVIGEIDGITVYGQCYDEGGEPSVVLMQWKRWQVESKPSMCD